MSTKEKKYTDDPAMIERNTFWVQASSEDIKSSGKKGEKDPLGIASKSFPNESKIDVLGSPVPNLIGHSGVKRAKVP